MNTDQTQHLATIAAILPQAITNRLATLQDLRAQLEALNSISCTGTVYWRDTSNGQTQKLYVNHGKDQSCPIHGQPKPGGRLRCYVGTNEEKQQQAMDAIETEKERKLVQRQVHALESTFNTLNSKTRDLFLILGYTYPDDGSPEPDPNWSPVTESWRHRYW